MYNASILNDLLEYLNLPVSRFEAEIGASSGAVRKAIERKAEISNGMARKIVLRFPQVNKDWLLTGKGEMINDSPHRATGKEISDNKAFGENEKRKVPVLGEAVAGTNQELNTYPAYTDQYIDVGDLLRDSEAAFTVYGNSMTPAYPSGCVVGLRRNYDGFIQPGETYVIETASNRVFKRLYWNKEKTAYECYSDNKMIEDSGERKGKFFYEMFEVPVDSVIRLFDVTGMIKRNRNSAIVEKV